MICGMRVDLSSFATFNIESFLFFSIPKFNAIALIFFSSEKSLCIDKSSRGKKQEKRVADYIHAKILLRKDLFLSRSTSRRRQQLSHQINFQHEQRRKFRSIFSRKLSFHSCQFLFLMYDKTLTIARSRATKKKRRSQHDSNFRHSKSRRRKLFEALQAAFPLLSGALKIL